LLKPLNLIHSLFTSEDNEATVLLDSSFGSIVMVPDAQIPRHDHSVML